MYEKEVYIEKLGLVPLLTTDWLREVYRSDEHSKGSCSFIFYLMEKNTIFPFHKSKGEGSWQYYAGDPITLFVIEEKNKMVSYTIGPEICKNQKILHIVPSNLWYAAKTSSRDFTLLIHCFFPRYRSENDAFGFYEDIKSELPDICESEFKSLVCEKGKNDIYKKGDGDTYFF